MSVNDNEGDMNSCLQQSHSLADGCCMSVTAGQEHECYTIHHPHPHTHHQFLPMNVSMRTIPGVSVEERAGVTFISHSHTPLLVREQECNECDTNVPEPGSVTHPSPAFTGE